LGIQLTLLGIFLLMLSHFQGEIFFMYLAAAATVFGTVLSILFAFKEK